MVTRHSTLQDIHSVTRVMVSGSFPSYSAFLPHSLAGGFLIQLVLAPLVVRAEGLRLGLREGSMLLLPSGACCCRVENCKVESREASRLMQNELGSGDDALPKISPLVTNVGSREKGIHPSC